MLGAETHATHEVMNQAPPLADFNAYASDKALKAAVTAFGTGWAEDRLHNVGATVGSTHVQELARLANRHGPELETHDRFGNRTDQVEFHPAWHELMALAVGQEVHCLPWVSPRAGAHTARAAISYLWNQGENGILCPLLMTFAAVPALRHDPKLTEFWQPLLTSRTYDGRQAPAVAKRGATAGMAMTEKQGGSDLRQTQTTATRNGDGTWSITGHKWFFSCPQSDLFLTLARTPAGVSCFAVAGWLPDGSRNRLLIQRLKDKVGNRSNASCEVEFRGLIGTLLGEDGHGIRAILEMGHLTRMDVAISSAGIMRLATAHATHHCQGRLAFQRRLIDQPMMLAVLADLALESEAAMWTALRVADAYDKGQTDPAERALNRLLAPVVKYWVAKRCPGHVVEALECHGGNGFIDTHPLARLYREAPLNSIWEGSGNVICLDVVRALSREPAAADAFRRELGTAKGSDRRYDIFVDALLDDMGEIARRQDEVRHMVERMALALGASLLIRHSDPAVADAFCASRLAGRWSGAYGTLPRGCETRAIAERAAPRDA